MAKKVNEITVDVIAYDKTPEYMTEEAVGADLYACNDEDIVIYPNFRAEIPLKIKAAIPDGYAGLILPRSGNAWNYGLTVLNAPGLIDPDFRGEWKVILINHGNHPHTISKGDRVAQLIIIPFVRVKFNKVGELSSTERGDGGLGHTGK
jgi:dUTP pyrophosphatase